VTVPAGLLCYNLVAMPLVKPSEQDLLGLFFFKTDSLADYYQRLEILRPLLTDEQWWDVVTGYYLNRIRGNLRLSFFTSSPSQVEDLVTDFVSREELEFPKEPKAEPPSQIKIAQKYGGEESRFRCYLSTYPLIGLDLMGADLLNARCLFTTLRWQLTVVRAPYIDHLRHTFESQSPLYNSLSTVEQAQFWKDLDHRPPQQTYWAHMLVNMVLGMDWELYDQRPLSIAEINSDLIKGNFGFQIPGDWTTSSDAIS